MPQIRLEDLIHEAPSVCREKAIAVFERAFNSIIWSTVEENIVQNRNSINQWHHRSTTEIESDLAYLEIDRQELISAFSDYLATPQLSSKNADWFFLNSLIYAEYLATLNEIRIRVMGIEKYIKSLYPPSTNHIFNISVLTGMKLMFAERIIASICSWLIHPALGIPIILWTIYSIYMLKTANEKVNNILYNMLTTYLCLNTTDLSWKQVTSILQHSSTYGVIWDASLFYLAECCENSNVYA